MSLFQGYVSSKRGSSVSSDMSTQAATVAAHLLQASRVQLCLVNDLNCNLSTHRGEGRNKSKDLANAQQLYVPLQLGVQYVDKDWYP